MKIFLCALIKLKFIRSLCLLTDSITLVSLFSIVFHNCYHFRGDPPTLVLLVHLMI